MSEGWDEKAIAAFARMRKGLQSGKGVRISWEELEVIDRTFLGEVMAISKMEIDEKKSLRTPPKPSKE